MKKRGKLKTKSNFSNRIIYFFIALGICALLSTGVYAYTASGAGHNSDEIDFTSGVTSSIFTTAQPTYGQTYLNTWGLSSKGTIYIEPNAGDDLYIVPTDWTNNLNTIIYGDLSVSSSVKALSFIYSSDKSLKTNIQPLENSLEKVLQLQGVSFNWKENGKEDIGLIAQDVEAVFPELVSGEDGEKSVEYGNLVAVLIEAIKEQQKQINELKEQLNNQNE